MYPVNSQTVPVQWTYEGQTVVGGPANLRRALASSEKGWVSSEQWNEHWVSSEMAGKGRDDVGIVRRALVGVGGGRNRHSWYLVAREGIDLVGIESFGMRLLFLTQLAPVSRLLLWKVLLKGDVFGGEDKGQKDIWCWISKSAVTVEEVYFVHFVIDRWCLGRKMWARCCCVGAKGDSQ
ncbi:hypothetical protein RHGRI_017094 [Rhododendron griersonianum]|uniref:Uncharacterized protein n=1 Tax=Rhododendron griersonianum TaxID=479676 RepID=A0AAV6JWI8_9ERIC|nr:hypothetical protein RHGRI_017094 [Rhododendron griersonianum]